MKFTFNFNGFSVTGSNTNIKLDNIEVTYEVTPAEFAEIMANNRELIKSLPGLVDQFKNIITEVSGGKKK